MKLSPLKVLSLVIAGVGMLVANELQKREINEAVEKALAEREQARIDSNTNGTAS